MEPTLTPDEFESLRRLSTCAVANAIETFNIRLRNEGFASDSAVRCMFPELSPMLGYAVTGRIRSATAPLVSSLPPPQRLSFADRTDWWDYVLSIPQPRVMVLQDIDPSPGMGAFVGDVHAAICQALGCVGYITNGAVRDIEAVRTTGFHFFAGNVSVSHAFAHIVDFGQPVAVGHMEVRPGCLIHGDRHGAQTIPLEIADKLPAVAAEMIEDEQKLIQLCHSTDFSVAQLRAEVDALRQKRKIGK